MAFNRRIYLSKKIINELWKRDKGVCQYCGEPAVEIDHIIPYGLYDSSQAHEIDNLALSCLLCNRLAGGRIFEDFIEKKNYILDKRLKRIGKYYGFPSGPQRQAKEEKPKPLRTLPKGLTFISKKTKVVSPIEKVEKVEKKYATVKCSGPSCDRELDLKRPWSKFHSTRCKTNYHIYKNTLVGVLSLFPKPAALDMLDNLKRRIERGL